MKLNLGCGGNRLEGFENHDADVDISKPLPWPDNSVDFILIEHCWEHIDSHAALRCLDECYRILKPGGVLRLCVPVLDRLERDHGRDIVFGHGHQAAYSTVLIFHLLRLAGFKPENTQTTDRATIDGHWHVIGKEKDDLETARIEAVK
jgi:predicted SAM-dependent methyltransferase